MSNSSSTSSLPSADAGAVAYARRGSAATVEPASTKFFSGNDSKDGMRNFLAGSLSGFACKMFEYPFDTVKVLQQTGGDRFKGPLDAFSKTVKSHGFFSLYSGLSSPLAGAMAENAIVFASYAWFKKQLGANEDDDKWAHPLVYAFSGMGAGFFSASILTPVELVKCNIQVQQAELRAGTAAAPGVVPFKGPVDVVIRTLKSEGIQGLYRGHAACLMRELPGNFAWFGVYEGALRASGEYFGYNNRREIPLGLKALCGSVGGVAYWVVPFPFDTAKSLLQTDATYRNWPARKVLQTVYAKEGVKGLYKGLTVTCVRAAPAHALIFLSYEWCVEFLARF